jgi:hypothetical protein
VRRGTQAAQALRTQQQQVLARQRGEEQQADLGVALQKARLQQVQRGAHLLPQPAVRVRLRARRTRVALHAQRREAVLAVLLERREQLQRVLLADSEKVVRAPAAGAY